MYKEAEGCRDFIIVKDFYKYGSACMCFKPDDQNSFRYLLTQCLLLAKWPIQVVRLGGPKALDSYGEYAHLYILHRFTRFIKYLHVR